MSKNFNSSSQVSTQKSSSYESTLRHSRNPSLKQIWDRKMANYENSLLKDMNEVRKLILDDPRYVMFDGIDSVQNTDEYRQCEITHIKKVISTDR